MKIIIDANVASEFLQKTEEAKAILIWIFSKGLLSTGGLNLKELSNTRIAPLVEQILRAGRGRNCPSQIVDDARKTLDINLVKSNDHHILALAIADGARLIYTRDLLLIKDFRNKNIISNPRGRCYSRFKQHKHLLC